MPSKTWFGRIQALDVRLLAAIGATILLITGVMWVVPTTPNSQSFTFDSARRTIDHARPIELGKPVEGSIVDGSDTEFYRIGPLQGSIRLGVHLTTGSAKMIPGLRIFNDAKALIQDQTAPYIQQPGADIEASLTAESGMTYYLQILSQRNTTGPYTITVTASQP